jgi:hypothetical protein
MPNAERTFAKPSRQKRNRQFRAEPSHDNNGEVFALF